jgi:hypothetical protein
MQRALTFKRKSADGGGMQFRAFVSIVTTCEFWNAIEHVRVEDSNLMKKSFHCRTIVPPQNDADNCSCQIEMIGSQKQL